MKIKSYLAVPKYAVLPLIGAFVVVLVPVVAFYGHFGTGFQFSPKQENWHLFAEYFGGIAGPPMALVTSYLIVVTVRETLDKATEQASLTRDQTAIQERSATLATILDVHRTAQTEITQKSLLHNTVAAVENEMFNTRNLLLARELRWVAAYGTYRNGLQEVMFDSYVSSVALCLRILFEQDTGEGLSAATMRDQGPKYHPAAVFGASLSEDEIRLLYLEAYMRSLEKRHQLGALLCWARIRQPVISGYVLATMTPMDTMLNEAYHVYIASLIQSAHYEYKAERSLD